MDDDYIEEEFDQDTGTGSGEVSRSNGGSQREYDGNGSGGFSGDDGGGFDENHDGGFDENHGGGFNENHDGRFNENHDGGFDRGGGRMIGGDAEGGFDGHDGASEDAGSRVVSRVASRVGSVDGSNHRVDSHRERRGSGSTGRSMDRPIDRSMDRSGERSLGQAGRKQIAYRAVRAQHTLSSSAKIVAPVPQPEKPHARPTVVSTPRMVAPQSRIVRREIIPQPSPGVSAALAWHPHAEERQSLSMQRAEISHSPHAMGFCHHERRGYDLHHGLPHNHPDISYQARHDTRQKPFLIDHNKTYAPQLRDGHSHSHQQGRGITNHSGNCESPTKHWGTEYREEFQRSPLGMEQSQTRWAHPRNEVPPNLVHGTQEDPRASTQDNGRGQGRQNEHSMRHYKDGEFRHEHHQIRNSPVDHHSTRHIVNHGARKEKPVEGKSQFRTEPRQRQPSEHDEIPQQHRFNVAPRVSMMPSSQFCSRAQRVPYKSTRESLPPKSIQGMIQASANVTLIE